MGDQHSHLRPLTAKPAAMGWLDWFRRSSSPDYETVLSSLEREVKLRESRLLSIRLRERRASVLLVSYALALWIAYVAAWYWHLIPRSKRDGVTPIQSLVRALPVIGAPLVILFTRRAMRWWFKRKQDSEETKLRVLKKQQRDKLEELKRKTGYYSTRDLIERYDDAVARREGAAAGARQAQGKQQQQTASTPMRRGSSTPVKGSPNSGGGAKGQQQQEPHEGGTPRTSGHGGNALVTGGTPAPGSPMMAGSGPPHGPAPPLLPPAPSAPLERTIFDRLADALLGVSPDEAAAAGGAATSKYALICGACFAHNGLVAKEEYDSIQYICPRCGYFNPPRKGSARVPPPAAASMMGRDVSIAGGRQPTTSSASAISGSGSGSGSGGVAGEHRRVQSMLARSPLSASSAWEADTDAPPVPALPSRHQAQAPSVDMDADADTGASEISEGEGQDAREVGGMPERLEQRSSARDNSRGDGGGGGARRRRPNRQQVDRTDEDAMDLSE